MAFLPSYVMFTYYRAYHHIILIRTNDNFGDRLVRKLKHMLKLNNKKIKN